jgi:hypothetical protein
MYDRVPKMNAVDDIQEAIEFKQLDPTMQLQLIENATMTGRELPTIERISSLDNGEVSIFLKQKEMSLVGMMRKQLPRNTRSGNATSEQSQRVTSENRYLYGSPESADGDQVRHFIYCITPTVMSRNMTICVLYLMQRKVINRKGTGPRYKYDSSLLYMKLPSYNNFGIHYRKENMNNIITSLDTDVKKKIIQLVKYRNQCFKDKHSSKFYDGQLMDRPITLSSNCKAHIAVHQSVVSPYLLSITLQDEPNAMVSSTNGICVILYANLMYLH